MRSAFAVVVLLMLAGLIGGYVYVTHGPCGTSKVAAAKEHIVSIERRWRDELRLAEATSRVSLDGPIAALQATRQEAANLVVPPCMLTARAEVVKAMDSGSGGLMIFMGHTGEASEEVATDAIREAREDMDKALRAVDHVVACAPSCEAALEHPQYDVSK